MKIEKVYAIAEIRNFSEEDNLKVVRTDIGVFVKREEADKYCDKLNNADNADMGIFAALYLVVEMDIG